MMLPSPEEQAMKIFEEKFRSLSITGHEALVCEGIRYDRACVADQLEEGRRVIRNTINDVGKHFPDYSTEYLLYLENIALHGLVVSLETELRGKR